MRRTALTVPAHLVASLHVPALSVANGEPDVEWVEIPTSMWRFRRRPAQRLPLDLRSARRARRYIRLAPRSVLPGLVTLLALIGILARQLPAAAFLTAALVDALLNLMWTLTGVVGELPAQTPSRDRHGNLRIPEVPLAVARQWQELNSGVTTSEEPAPRPRSRRFYATSSAGLLLAAVTLGVLLANDGRDDFFLLVAAVPVLFVAGCAMALKLLPPGYIRFDHADH